MTKTRLVKGALLAIGAVGLGVATLTWPRAEGVTPGYCTNRCGPSSSCLLSCTDPYTGEVINCGLWGVCGQTCSTYKCAAGCAPKPSWTLSGNDLKLAVGEEGTFTANTSNIYANTTNWDFGDGTFAFGAQVTHAYNREGDFRACLSANETTCGTVQFSCKTIQARYVTVPPPCDGCP